MESLTPTFNVLSKEQSGAIEQMESAQIDKQIATAKRYPRDLKEVRNEMMSAATIDQASAEKVFYKLPRKNKVIEGPSIRMAEIAISAWGNLRVQNRVVETVASGDHPFVMVRAEVLDLQKNVAVAVEKRRRITGKKKWVDGLAVGNLPPDDDDINLATNACSSIAIRDAVFKVIPQSFITPVFEAAKKTAIGTHATLADRRAKCIESFSKMGVDKVKILALLEKQSVEDIDLEDLGTLIGVFTAIKDGEQTIDEVFQIKPKNTPAPSVAPVASPAPVVLAETKAATPPATAAAGAPKETPPDPAVTQKPVDKEATPTPAAPASTPAAAPAAPPATELPPLDVLKGLMTADGVSMEQVMAFLRSRKIAKADQKDLAQISSSKLRNLATHWSGELAEIKKAQ